MFKFIVTFGFETNIPGEFSGNRVYTWSESLSVNRKPCERKWLTNVIKAARPENCQPNEYMNSTSLTD